MSINIPTINGPAELVIWLDNLNTKKQCGELRTIEEVYFQHGQSKSYLRFEKNHFYHNNLLDHPPLKIVLILLYQFLTGKSINDDLTQLSDETIKQYISEIKNSLYFCDYHALTLPMKVEQTKQERIMNSAISFSFANGKTLIQAKLQIEDAIRSQAFDTTRTWQPPIPVADKKPSFLSMFSRSRKTVADTSASDKVLLNKRTPTNRR